MLNQAPRNQAVQRVKRLAVVTVPYITREFHFNWAVRTVLSLLSIESPAQLDLIAIVNSCSSGQAHLDWFKKTFDYLEINDRNILARGWNKGIKLGLERGADAVLVINLDLIFHSKFLVNLLHFAESRPEILLSSGTPWPDESSLEQATLEGVSENFPHYNCFMLDHRLLEQVGEFDEQFEPAYHEDMDMAYRMRLADVAHAGTNSARFYHFDRVTLKGALYEKDQELLEQTRMQMDESMRRYVRKWGGLPGEEKYLKPYGA